VLGLDGESGRFMPMRENAAAGRAARGQRFAAEIVWPEAAE
jgi:hypothetical protein